MRHGQTPRLRGKLRTHTPSTHAAATCRRDAVESAFRQETFQFQFEDARLGLKERRDEGDHGGKYITRGRSGDLGMCEVEQSGNFKLNASGAVGTGG